MKYIAVVDIPDNVFDIYEELTIRGNINFGGEHPLVMTLKPLPDKFPFRDISTVKTMNEAYTTGYNDGFNACIDEITGETE